MSLESIGQLEHLVLLAIARLGADSYGVTIVEELESHLQRPVLRPSVYLALRRLEARGLIRSRMGEPEARRGGRARKHFDVSPAGARVLRESQRAFTSLWQGVSLARKR